MTNTKKVLRTIIEIDEELCIGCGLCVSACEMGAIQLIDGVAKLVEAHQCDGIGNCIPECPTDAIKKIEKEIEIPVAADTLPCGCPGTMAKAIKREVAPTKALSQDNTSQLQQWPVQIKLVGVTAPYLQNADLLIAADCTAYAYGNFHQDFIKGRVVLVGCPKLDDLETYTDKFTQVLLANNINSITVARMEVPCCTGISTAVQKAIAASGKNIPLNDCVIALDGTVIK